MAEHLPRSPQQPAGRWAFCLGLVRVGGHARYSSKQGGAVLLALLAVFAAITLQGCLPPDWSFCDCDFRDNFWSHVLNDVNLLWDGPGFRIKARDNTTFQGRYLQGPLPEGYDCPVQANVFWKAWPRYGMSRGLIEGTMGDLWMPGARDRVKQICMAGHFALCVICSQHFLVKAGQALEAGDPDHMKWLEAAYGHMVAIRNLGTAYQLRNCMGQQGWPLKVKELYLYAERWLGGPEREGTSPVAAYFGGRLDPYEMLFDEPMAHTERSRLDALPDRRPCVPLKNPKCWKRMSKLLIETCEYCCSPFIHKTGRGNAWCFDSEWTYERCCQTDYKDLVCELIRKGEEGGCVDCKKSVRYVCLTPPEKRLQDAQENYNSEVDRYNGMLSKHQTLKQDVESTRIDLIQKEGMYRENHTEFSSRLNIWSEAFNNRTRMLSMARLQQQQRSWNNSAAAERDAQEALRAARASLQNASAELQQARAAEARGRELLQRNETAHERAVRDLAAARAQLEEAQAAQVAAEEASSAAREALAAALDLEAERSRALLAANASRDEVYRETAAELDAAMAIEAAAALLKLEAASRHADAEAAVLACRNESAAAHESLRAVTATLLKAQEEEGAAEGAAKVSLEIMQQAQQSLQLRGAELAVAKANRSRLHEALLNRSGMSEAMKCLIEHTPANATAQPQVVPGIEMQADRAPCDLQPNIEDENEFCRTWAAAGECERNPEYMQQSCRKSCGGGSSTLPVPACSGLPAQEEPLLPHEELLAIILGMEMLLSSSTGTHLETGFELSTAAEADDSLHASVAAASIALHRSRERVGQRQGELQAAVAAVQAAVQAQAAALAEEDSRRQDFIKASDHAASMQALVLHWQTLVGGNQSDVASSRATRDVAWEDLAEKRDMANEAKESEGNAVDVQRVTREKAARQHAAVKAAKRRQEVVQDHIEVLNASISDNLTDALAIWLEEFDSRHRAGPELSWTSQVFGMAKRALISAVGFLESFLERHGVSLHDQTAVKELVQAVEDRRLAIAQVDEAEAQALAMDADAEAAIVVLAEASTATRRAEEAVNKSADHVALCEELLRAAEELLQLTQDEAASAERASDAARRAAQEREVQLTRATNMTAVANSSLLSTRGERSRREEALEVARAEVVEATATIALAEKALANAQEEAAKGYLTKLQRQCNADEAQFRNYLQEQELLGLVRAGTEHAEARHLAADRLSKGSASNLSAAEHALDMARQRLAGAVQAQLDCRDAVVRVDARCSELGQVWNSSSQDLEDKQAELEVAKNHTARVRRPREVADEVAENTTRESLLASTMARRAANHSAQAAGVALIAAEETQAKSLRVSEAEVQEANASDALEAAKLWLVGFTRSLQIERKEGVLEQATSLERTRQAAQEKATGWERRMKLLLGTHERHLKLVNLQNELAEKEAARVVAKDAFTKAENAVMDAQKKLDGLVKEEEELAVDIVKSRKKLGELLEEHGLAQEGYNNQDPKERSRSFSTMLEGSGADPNGVEIR